MLYPFSSDGSRRNYIECCEVIMSSLRCGVGCAKCMIFPILTNDLNYRVHATVLEILSVSIVCQWQRGVRSDP